MTIGLPRARSQLEGLFPVKACVVDTLPADVAAIPTHGAHPHPYRGECIPLDPRQSTVARANTPVTGLILPAREENMEG